LRVPVETAPPDVGAHQPFGAGLQLGDRGVHGLDVIPVEQLRQSLLADREQPGRERVRSDFLHHRPDQMLDGRRADLLQGCAGLSAEDLENALDPWLTEGAEAP
jgi:hypothetical protein